jgi:hypothetical protein
MSDLYQTSADLRSAVQDLARVESPSAALTLTRSGTLSITTAGTLITWQTETRNQGFTWATTNITVPTSGYYAMSLTYTASGAHTSSMRLFVNTVNVAFMTASSVASTRHGFSWVRYFTTDDVVSFNVLPSANVTVSVNAEGVASESPILHIAQLTGVI